MVPALVAAATGEAMPADEFLMDMLPPPMRGNAPIHVQLPVGIGHSNGYTVIDTSGCGGEVLRVYVWLPALPMLWCLRMELQSPVWEPLRVVFCENHGRPEEHVEAYGAPTECS